MALGGGAFWRCFGLDEVIERSPHDGINAWKVEAETPECSAFSMWGYREKGSKPGSRPPPSILILDIPASRNIYRNTCLLCKFLYLVTAAYAKTAPYLKYHRPQTLTFPRNLLRFYSLGPKGFGFQEFRFPCVFVCVFLWKTIMPSAISSQSASTWAGMDFWTSAEETEHRWTHLLGREGVQWRVCRDRGNVCSAGGPSLLLTYLWCRWSPRYSEAWKKSANFTDALGRKVTWLAGMKVASVMTAVV